MTKDEALKMAQSGWWKEKVARQIVDFQLYEDRLCMPFKNFQAAVEEVLGRPVWTHEFADPKGLQAEYEGKRLPENNPLESAHRILHKLGRDDLADNMIVIVTDDKLSKPWTEDDARALAFHGGDD